jgi:hypothetical protein
VADPDAYDRLINAAVAVMRVDVGAEALERRESLARWPEGMRG